MRLLMSLDMESGAEAPALHTLRDVERVRRGGAFGVRRFTGALGSCPPSSSRTNRPLPLNLSRIPDPRFALVFTLLALWFLAIAPPACAGLPQPMCVLYGQARDGYGLPYRANADVILLHGTNEVARHTVRGSLAPGVNFALYVHLDDGREAMPYSTRALSSGASVRIVVRDADGEKTVMENASIPPVGQPGSLLLLNVTAAPDTDGDGLPDPWEWELNDWSNGVLTSLWDVQGEDDFDGDGMSNAQEYAAGTFAFLDYDYLAVEQTLPTANGWLCLTFLTVPGKTYSVRGATNLAEPVWLPCSFSVSEAAPVQTAPAEGNGDWLSLYVPLDESMRFFRVVAE